MIKKRLLDGNTLWIVGGNYTVKYQLSTKTRTVYNGVPEECSGKVIDKRKESELLHKFWHSKQWEWEYNGSVYKTIPYNEGDELVWYNGRVYICENKWWNGSDRKWVKYPSKDKGFWVSTKWLRSIQKYD